MTTNSYILTTKERTIMKHLAHSSKRVEAVLQPWEFIPTPKHYRDIDWGDVYDEYLDFNVCSQTW